MNPVNEFLEEGFVKLGGFLSIKLTMLIDLQQ